MIIVFGSLLIDQYIPIEKLPPPGSQVSGGDYTSYPGGTGANQAVSARRSGAKTAIIGMVGDDAFGRRSTQNLRRENILGSGIGQSDRPTGCAIILPGTDEDKTIISCAGANLDTRSDQVPNEILGPKSTVIGQLLVPIDETIDLFQRTRERGGQTVLNAAPPQDITADILKLTDMLFVNEMELKTMARPLGLDPTLSIRALTQKICEDFNLNCITTLGSKGSIARVDRQFWAVGALPETEVVDANGAGDCFMGYLLGMMDQGHNFTKALHTAAVAGSLACRREGAQSAVPFPEEVAENMGALPAPQKL